MTKITLYSTCHYIQYSTTAGHKVRHKITPQIKRSKQCPLTALCLAGSDWLTTFLPQSAINLLRYYTGTIPNYTAWRHKHNSVNNSARLVDSSAVPAKSNPNAILLYSAININNASHNNMSATQQNRRISQNTTTTTNKQTGWLFRLLILREQTASLSNGIFIMACRF